MGRLKIIFDKNKNNSGNTKTSPQKRKTADPTSSSLSPTKKKKKEPTSGKSSQKNTIMKAFQKQKDKK